jgi:uncharacterized membrane protein YeaQ/YmgE (transglycosylase-associated protein family)
MNGVGIIGWIVIGIAAGWIAEKVMRRDHGLLTNLIVGVVGAFIGGFLASLLGVAYSGWLYSLIAAVIGACVLLALLSLFRRRT